MESSEQTIFYSIEKAIKSYRQFAQKNISESGFEITIDQGLILNIIRENPGISQQQIAAKAFKDHASVSRIIEHLVGRKILNRDFHAGDRRRFSLSITDLGLNILERMEPIVDVNRKSAVSGMSADDIATLKELLKKITDNCTQKS